MLGFRVWDFEKGFRVYDFSINVLGWVLRFKISKSRV